MSNFTNKSRTPEDTVFYTIHPDSSLNSTDTPQTHTLLQSLHLQILEIVTPFTSQYIWQHQPFNLNIPINASITMPHLFGKTHYGDNIEDEWFIVWLLMEVTRRVRDVSVRVWDSDGEFLLIEAAFMLPKWVKPDTSGNRVFLRGGEVCIVPMDGVTGNPVDLKDSLRFMRENGGKARAGDGVQEAVRRRVEGYPIKARRNMHRVRVRVPVKVAQVLEVEPCLVSLAVEGFYDRDIDSMKYASKMERFLSGGKGEELVLVSVVMSKAMYAQLVQQMFQAPSCYPMSQRGGGDGGSVYLEAELGMKIACGFEMMYQHRRGSEGEGEGSNVEGSSWDAFRESLESNGYFKGLLSGSKEYKRLMENAQEYYRNSSLFSRTSEMMNAPVKRIDEILSVSHSADDFKGLEVPPSDNDAWLYDGEDELNSAFLERQKELEIYESKHKKGQASREHKSTNQSFDPSDLAKTMQAFVQKISSYEGAEVPGGRDSETVDFNVDSFMRDMESVIGHIDDKGKSNDADMDEGSSSDMDDFDESDNDSDNIEDGDLNDTFGDTYFDVLNKQLKDTSMEKSFVRANEQTSRRDDEGTSNTISSLDEDFTAVDVDVNLVKSLLDSFSSQQGLPGPASNLLGAMGLHIPQDTSKDK